MGLFFGLLNNFFNCKSKFHQPTKFAKSGSATVTGDEAKNVPLILSFWIVLVFHKHKSFFDRDKPSSTSTEELHGQASLFFKKNGPIPASFCPFSLFSRYNFNNTNRKKLRWCAWDSNPGPQDGRRRQNHGVMAATQSLISFLTPLPLTYYLLTIRKVHWKVIKQVRKDLANTFYPLNCRLPLYVPRYKLGRIFLFSGLMLFQYFMQWMNGFR